MTFPRTLFLLALVSAAMLAGCGGGSSKTATPTSNAGVSPTAAADTVVEATGQATTELQPTATAAAKDPCSYATVAEVQTTTGKTVTGTPTKVNDFVCSYLTSDSGTVNIGVASPLTKSVWEGQVKAAFNGTPASISGLGDEAFAIYFGVAVFKGSTSISVEVSPSSTQTGGAAAIALAKLVLARI